MVCQAVNAVGETGVDGRHYEWYPLDEGGEEAAQRIALDYHEEVERAKWDNRHGMPNPSPKTANSTSPLPAPPATSPSTR